MYGGGEPGFPYEGNYRDFSRYRNGKFRAELWRRLCIARPPWAFAFQLSWWWLRF
jgi:hypothetical protein